MSGTDLALTGDIDDRGALMRTYADPLVTFVRGEGSWLFDVDGRRYLDFIGGLAVTSLGHAHPAVTEAVSAQAATLTHVSNLYGNTVAPAVAATIDRLIGGGEVPAGGQVFFCNSGAEANECALKLVRRWSGAGRPMVVATEGAFHGRTMGALSATGQPDKQAAFEPMLEGFTHVPYDDLGRLARALEGPGAVGVILEPIQGEGGVVTPSSDYLSGARELCTEHGALLVLDEVQTGFGRTGAWFAFQHRDLRPDIVTMAKAMGNGMPVGACWARAEVAAAFNPGDHGTTFGGQPLAMSAVRATLQVMEEEDVCGRAHAGGELLRDRLAALPGVGAVRGAGLLLAAELVAPVARTVAEQSLSAGLLVNAVRSDVVRVAPSLLVSDEEMVMATDILSGVIADVLVRRHGPARGRPA